LPPPQSMWVVDIAQRHRGGGGNRMDRHVVKLGNENVRALGEKQSRPGFDPRAELTDSPPGTEQGSGDVTECHTFGEEFGGPVGCGRGPRAAVLHAVYTSVRMLEIHPRSLTLSHFLDRPARLADGKARSATRCSIMRSDMTGARPGRLNTEWDGCTESPISTFADCSLFQHGVLSAFHASRSTLHAPRPMLRTGC
jgi:hypothetical protein